MIEQFSAPENVLFAIALGLFVIICIWVTLATLLGFGFATPLDDFIPDFDLDLKADVTFTASVLSWLNLGRLPLIVSLLIWLFIFAFLGFNIQELFLGLGLGRLPGFIAAPIAFVLSLYPLKWGNYLMAKIIPRDETAAISGDSHIGLVALITLGEAKGMKPAEARVKGIDGKTYHILVVPDNEDESFLQGSEALIVGRKGAYYSVIQVDTPGLR